MSPQEPPELVKWALIIGVPTLMVVLTLLIPVRLLLIAKVPRFRAFMAGSEYARSDLGVNVFWPKTLKVRVSDFDRLARILIREMSKPGLLHASRAQDALVRLRLEIRDHILSSAARVAAGLGDLNKDGVEDKFSGLTHSTVYIEIMAVNDTHHEMIDKDGFVIAERTAFRYELLNVLIWLTEGYEVAFAERLVGLKEAVGNENNEKNFERRRQYDDVYAKIDWNAV